MLKKFLLSIVLIISVWNLHASDSIPKWKFEFVLNITNAISRFSGNGVRNINEDPYMFALKLRNKTNQHAFRLGINQSYTSQKTQLFPGERRTRDFYISPIIGHEWRKHLDRHFMFFYGIDVRAGFRNGTVEIVDGGLGATQIISSEERGYGVGPFCGFVWKVNKNISFFTEANLYANRNNTYRYIDDGISRTVLEDSHKWVFTPVVPTSLFLSVTF
jgi:hypothetical protein